MPLTTRVGRLRLSSSTVLSAELVTMSNKDVLFKNNTAIRMRHKRYTVYMLPYDYNVKRGKLYGMM